MINYDYDYIEKEYGHDTYVGVGEGWVALVNTLTDGIHEILDRQNNASDSADIKLEILQIKEKFGGLRYYYTLTHEDDVYYDLDEGTQNSVSRYVAQMEQVSYHICEECGKFGERHTTNGWIKTVCEEHKENG